MRVVGSLTTIPGREKKLLRTLRSLHAQDYKLDAIYLGIPQKSRRLGLPYPEFSSSIKDLCTIVMCDHDYGPGTKIVAGLLRESDPTTVIITFDDDVIYSPSLVRKLIELHIRHPQAAIGSSGILLRYGFPFYSTVNNCPGHWNNLTGFSLEKDVGRRVDALCGFSSILYVRESFPNNDKLYEEFLKYPLLDNDVYYNDDIMISAYLSGRHVDRLVFNSIPPVNEDKKYDEFIDGADVNAISFDKIAFLQRFRRAIIKTKEWGFFPQTEIVSYNETIGWKVFLIIVSIIILIILCIILYRMQFLPMTNAY
jgi:hypothetical protein